MTHVIVYTYFEVWKVKERQRKKDIYYERADKQNR